MKLFTTAERMENWKLYMYCVCNTLSYLHARGHIAYARSAHLYQQTMDDIKINMNPVEYTKLTKNCLFKIRRSDQLWAGTWSNMTIEQVLMRKMKTSGLTRGRGFSEKSLARWIGSMPSCIEVSQTIE